MAKTPSSPRRSREQLKTTVWPDRAAALRDLKASGVTERGEDYELGEHKPGSWMLLDRTEHDAEPAKPPAPTREDAVLDSLRKQPGKPPKGTPKVLVQALAPVKKPVNQAAAPKPKVKAETEAKPAVEPKPETKTNDKAAPTPESEIKPVEDSLFKPLPKEQGPFELVITEGAGPAHERHATHTAALELTKRLRTPIEVRGKDGAVLRRYDWDDIRRTQEAAKKANRGNTPHAGGRKPSGESRFARAFRLLIREQGATARELEKACDWENVTQRYVNRTARLNNDARLTVLGDKHWRLTPR